MPLRSSMLPTSTKRSGEPGRRVRGAHGSSGTELGITQRLLRGIPHSARRSEVASEGTAMASADMSRPSRTRRSIRSGDRR